MNAFVQQMGFPTSAYSFCDVLSTDDWAIEMVPMPVLAVIMLYPITPRVRAVSVHAHTRVYTAAIVQALARTCTHATTTGRGVQCWRESEDPA